MPGIVMSRGGTAGEVLPTWACLGTAPHCPPPTPLHLAPADLALLELKLGWPWGKCVGEAQPSVGVMGLHNFGSGLTSLAG